MKKIILLTTTLLLATQSFASNVSSNGKFITTAPMKILICHQFQGSVSSNSVIKLNAKDTTLTLYQAEGEGWSKIHETKTNSSGVAEIKNLGTGSKPLKLQMRYNGLTNETPYSLEITDTAKNDKGQDPVLNRQFSCAISGLSGF